MTSFSDKISQIIYKALGRTQRETDLLMSNPENFNPLNPNMTKVVMRISVNESKRKVLMDVLSKIHEERYKNAEKVMQDR